MRVYWNSTNGVATGLPVPNLRKGADGSDEDEEVMIMDGYADLVIPQAPQRERLRPMSPLAASSTVVNLLLATGPFS